MFMHNRCCVENVIGQHLFIISGLDCPTLTPPDNGELSPMGANSYNDEVTFTCNQNYELEGASSVKCQANGTWSDRIPTCTRETVFFLKI